MTEMSEPGTPVAGGQGEARPATREELIAAVMAEMAIEGKPVTRREAEEAADFAIHKTRQIIEARDRLRAEARDADATA